MGQAEPDSCHISEQKHRQRIKSSLWQSNPITSNILPCVTCAGAQTIPPSNHKILTPFDAFDQPWLALILRGRPFWNILSVLLWVCCVALSFHYIFRWDSFTIVSSGCCFCCLFLCRTLSLAPLDACSLWAGQHTRFHLALTLFLISNLTIRFQVPYPFSFISWSQKGIKNLSSKCK